MNKRHAYWLMAGACTVLSALLLALCSQCSPLFPINTWVDANCLLTVGRVMRAGGVVYRDIYEQKGPTLYLVEMLGACLSDRSFFGIYIMEVISLAAAMFAGIKLVGKRANPAAALTGTLAVFAAVVSSAAFSKGNSAEEFCLPLLTALFALTVLSYGHGPMKKNRLLLCGLLSGLIFTIKYTLLGAALGLCLCEGVIALKRGGLVRALQSAGIFLLGMGIPVAVWSIYFLANGALADAFTAYFVNNMLHYGTELTLAERVREIARILRDNALPVALCVLGIALFVLDRRKSVPVRLCVLTMAAGQTLTVFGMGRVWPYSALALFPFALLGVEHAAEKLSDCIPKSAMHMVSACLCAAILALAGMCTPNAFLRGVPYASLAQARLAASIPAEATLLQYSHLDDGLYLAAGKLPKQKYFVRLNVASEEMRAELDRYVAQAEPDYVLVSWRELPAQFDRYELVAQDVGYDDADRLNKMLYLYRRKSE